MNNVVFNTGGDWDSTTLHNNDEEMPAERMFVELKTGRRDDGEPRNGGIANGGEMTAIINPQENPQEEIGIFPGRLQLTFPRHEVVVENPHPNFAFENTRVWHNNVEVTSQVVDLFVDIDAGNNNVKAYLVIYKPHWFGRDEVATYNII